MLSFKTKILDSVRSVFTRQPFEGILMSVLGGTRYDGFWTRFIPAPRLYKRGSLRNATRGGIKYTLDLSCLMQWYVFWGFKEVQRDRLYSLVNEGDVVLDVGTNVGETLLNFGKLVGDTGFVYGFEPDETNYERARANIALNGMKNVHVFHLGVSDSQAEAKLFRVDMNNLGMNRILSDREADEFDDFTVIQTLSLDEIVVANSIKRVDVIKIDVEGYEFHALRGAEKLLKTLKPKLFIEIGYRRLINLGTTPTELVAYLESFGYRIFHAKTDEEIGPAYDFSALGDGGIDVYALTA